MDTNKKQPTPDGPQIVVVDAKGLAHLVPAGNAKSLKGYNSRLPQDKRSKFFDYDPAHPEMEYYIAKAKGVTPGGGSNDFAYKKAIEKVDTLTTEKENLASENEDLKKQLEEADKKLKAALAEAKKAAKAEAKQ